MNIGKRLSIGYNRAGQEFFDFLSSVKDSVHSYFFNPEYTFASKLSWQEELEQMSKLNTYGIEANILFNFPFQTAKESQEILNAFLKLPNLNITSVTVTNQEMIDVFKKVEPSLKFHLSIHVPVESLSDITDNFNIEDIYCVNLNQKHIFNMDLISAVYNANIKVKLIANEYCMWDRNNWTMYFFGEKICNINGGIDNTESTNCGYGCRKKFKGEYIWLNLTRQGFTKEFLPYYDNKLDIIKISSRTLPMEPLKFTIGQMVSDEKSRLFDMCFFMDGIPDDFVEKRFKCDHKCRECSFCKEIFDKYVAPVAQRS